MNCLNAVSSGRQEIRNEKVGQICLRYESYKICFRYTSLEKEEGFERYMSDKNNEVS